MFFLNDAGQAIKENAVAGISFTTIRMNHFSSMVLQRNNRFILPLLVFPKQ